MALPLSALPGPEALASPVNTATVRHTRNTSIVSRHVAGETIVVPICRGVGDLDSVYTFNSVGQGLWQLLEDARTAEELAHWVATHYEVEAKQASKDVESYLAELTEIGLIRTV
ncbi:MAG: PqqD family protein [Candidatus Acidiferrum sp.]|jgi:hypothetical protein